MNRQQILVVFTMWLTTATASAQDGGVFAIQGRVVDADGQPVAGAAVRLLSPGFGGFDVDEKTKTDAEGQYLLKVPKSWSLMDATHRQELGIVAKQGDRLAVVQFHRNSALPRTEVDLAFAKVNEGKIAVLTPDLRPVAGAKISLGGLRTEMHRVDLTPAELQQMAGQIKKTAFGYVVGAGTVSLPPDWEMEIGVTDAKGVASVSKVGAAAIGALTIRSDEFGEQNVVHYGWAATTPANWPNRIVLKKTGRLVGQLTGPSAESIRQREVTLVAFQHDTRDSIAHGTNAKVVTDRDGKFTVPKMAAGSLQLHVKFDPAHPTRPEPTKNAPQLKAGETLDLKIAMKPAVRVEGRVLDADSKEPLRDVQVRAFFGIGFESTTSDAEGKFAFWMPPGQTAFHPTIPDDYLSSLRPSDYFDDAKRQRSIGIFDVPDGKSFQTPPVLLQRTATLRGVVVDAEGKPLAGSMISAVSMTMDRRTGQPKPLEIKYKVDARGEFAISGIDPRESVRLRATANEVSKIVTIAQPGRENVRVVLAANERFQIAGKVADAEGKPVAAALLEVWHRDWRPAPNEAEPKKLELPQLIRADAEGHFITPPLSPDGHYRFTVRGGGVKTTETAWLDATKPETTKPQQLVVTRLGGVSGVVRDRAGKAVADAQVFLFSNDTRTDTATNGKGEFSVEIPAGKPFCIVVRHPDFRVNGAYYEKNPANLDQTMLRLSEPAEKLAPRTIISKEDRENLLKQLVEPFKAKLAKASTQEKVSSLQSLTGSLPDFVTEFVEKHPLPSAQYNQMLLTQVAMKRAGQNPEEAEELIGRMPQDSQKSIAYVKLVDALPEKARARKLEILAEALVGARAEKGPEFRAIVMGQVAHRLNLLGEKQRATDLLREGEKVANGLSTSAFAGFARANFATDLALIDLPAALALMKDLKDSYEFARHHGNTAHRLAGVNPSDAVRVLDLIPPPGENEFNQRDQYAIRVCYRMSRVDLPAALKLANSIGDFPSRAYALGVIAQGVAKAEPKQAVDLVRRAYGLLEKDAARPDPPQLTSPLGRGTVAAALLLCAEQVDPTLVRECLWRSVALQRPRTEDPQHVWLYATGNNALAMAAARYDGKLAELLLAAPSKLVHSREGQLARFLANPQHAIANAAKAPATKGERDLVQLISYLATEEDQAPRLILNSLGIWRIDVEDIDF